MKLSLCHNIYASKIRLISA